ncbi:hypothetical protein THAOC_26942, partial [Thalassiosira oceanica]
PATITPSTATWAPPGAPASSGLSRSWRLNSRPPPRARRRPAKEETAEEETKAAPDAMYHGLAWGDIPDDTRAAYVALGYDEAYWNGEEEDPATSAMAWMELTAEEQEAATILGYDESSWCSPDDPACGSEFEHFLTPDLEAGYADLIKFEDDGVVVHDYAARVGMPEHLVPTLRKYAEDMGLWRIMENMLYEDPLEPANARWFNHFHSPYQTTDNPAQLRNFTWGAVRPAKNWKSDMHWFHTADELSHEDSLRALARGGFDSVLRGIGKRFGLKTLHVDKLGFIVVTNCQRGYLHTDFENVGGGAFNFLFGINSPEDGGPELIFETEDKMRRGEVYYGANAGILVGDGTRHRTRECDHRASHQVRITAFIYLVDLNDDNLHDVIAYSPFSISSPPYQERRKWTWTQRGRHWNQNNGSVSLINDVGRKPFNVSDVWDNCDKSKCRSGNQQVSVDEGYDMRTQNVVGLYLPGWIAAELGEGGRDLFTITLNNLKTLLRLCQQSSGAPFALAISLSASIGFRDRCSVRQDGPRRPAPQLIQAHRPRPARPHDRPSDPARARPQLHTHFTDTPITG